jgi:hypothetical protein
MSEGQPKKVQTCGDGEPAGWPRLGPHLRDRVEEGRGSEGQGAG